MFICKFTILLIIRLHKSIQRWVQRNLGMSVTATSKQY